MKQNNNGITIFSSSITAIEINNNNKDDPLRRTKKTHQEETRRTMH